MDARSKADLKYDLPQDKAAIAKKYTRTQGGSVEDKSEEKCGGRRPRKVNEDKRTLVKLLAEALAAECKMVEVSNPERVIDFELENGTKGYVAVTFRKKG